jgi:predicted dinucleotide-binding enzyme
VASRAGDYGKLRVMELVDKLSFEAVDAGPLKNVHLLEPLAMLWIDQAMTSPSRW